MSANSDVTKNNTGDQISPKALVAEFIGTMGLIFAAVGSIMLIGTGSATGSILETLACAIAVALVLFAMIEAFGPLSGGHFNPAISIGLMVVKEVSPKKTAFYIMAQMAGALVGMVLLNIMFYDDLAGFMVISENTWDTLPLFVSEIVGTFFLIAVVIGCVRSGSKKTSLAVAFVIGGLILATSTSMFANPAVDIARIFTELGCGIAPMSAMLFIVAQVIGAVLAAFLFGWLYPKANKE